MGECDVYIITCKKLFTSSKPLTIGILTKVTILYTIHAYLLSLRIETEKNKYFAISDEFISKSFCCWEWSSPTIYYGHMPSLQADKLLSFKQPKPFKRRKQPSSARGKSSLRSESLNWVSLLHPTKGMLAM